jgi:hypothetical protein
LVELEAKPTQIGSTLLKTGMIPQNTHPPDDPTVLKIFSRIACGRNSLLNTHHRPLRCKSSKYHAPSWRGILARIWYQNIPLTPAKKWIFCTGDENFNTKSLF